MGRVGDGAMGRNSEGESIRCGARPLHIRSARFEHEDEDGAPREPSATQQQHKDLG